ncbi:DUF1573 domain-containing protein [Singulisphaera acidiphila]|uniref:DUF1573 domain-containing protein n=1 Tax=Singulisphaera acidiphila (strain ATCC BAA-1392 / DSM 18658 / VKM B-2454 / MOB10) TaxID=886293 RepID=L0DJN3_SINAD|nr:DUF1573 domain-containing protein [Singulisphaera acidiphila]AGA29043.1 hypothetical protein Sinac_4885 [Singulisphaera acidiphila DSM 18658]
MGIRRIVLTLLAGLISTASFHLALRQRPSPAPLILSPVTHDCGTVEGSRTLEFRAYLKNTTPSPIYVNQVLTGCDCTTSEMRGAEVSPFGSVSFPLKWRLNGRRGSTSTSASVEYRVSPDSPFVVTTPLTLTCHVVEEYTVSPSHLVFSSDDERTRLEFHTNPGRPLVRINRLESTHPAIQAVLEPSPTDSGRQVVLVSLSSRQWGPVEGKDAALIIHTTCEHQPTFEVPVRVAADARPVKSG